MNRFFTPFKLSSQNVSGNLNNSSRLLILLLAFALFGGCKSNEMVEVVEPPTTEDPEEKQESIAKKIADADWEVDQISKAITWKYYHFDDLFSSNQSVTVIEVDLNKNPVVDIPYVTSGFLKTSDAAVDAKAVAAINGSFFDTSEGGSTVFFRKDGEIINYTRNGFTPYRENAGFAIDTDGAISIIKRPTSGWESVEVATLLTSGPLLVYDGEPMDQIQQAFNINRHPRTAIGLTEDNRLIAVVVDGRSSEAHGMTTEELAMVMDILGSEEAMNLDGGGSSAAWIKNRGVVNYPSDNKQFDHGGERAVATVITFGRESE